MDMDMGEQGPTPEEMESMNHEIRAEIEAMKIKNVS
jgi:hypothetical protein